MLLWKGFYFDKRTAWHRLNKSLNPHIGIFAQLHDILDGAEEWRRETRSNKFLSIFILFFYTDKTKDLYPF